MACLKKNLSVRGKMKNLMPLSIVVSVLTLVFISCVSPPPIRPALSQTVINIQRSATKLDTGKLYIYVDDQCINEKVPIGKGEGWSYPVNNGVHYIYGKCGKLTSDAINFTADSTTLSFSAEIVKESRQIGETKLFKKTKLFGITKLVINRSEVSDDTGRQTDQDIQESYGNIW